MKPTAKNLRFALPCPARSAPFLRRPPTNSDELRRTPTNSDELRRKDPSFADGRGSVFGASCHGRYKKESGFRAEPRGSFGKIRKRRPSDNLPDPVDFVIGFAARAATAGWRLGDGTYCVTV